MAAVMGWAVYAGLCWFLIYAWWRVLGSPSWPDWMVRLYYWKGKETVKGFFTIRYEEDDDGLWQVVEESATGDRYRVHIYDAERNYKW